MTRGETAGIGVAALGHLGLLALLLWTMAGHNLLPPLESSPIEVSISDEVGLRSQAPTPSREAPAERKADELGPVVPAAVPPAPEPAPEKASPTPPRAAPAPAPQPVKREEAAKASGAQTPQKAAAKPLQPTGRLTGLLNGLSDSPSKSQSTAPPAEVAGPAVQSALAAEIRRQLKPHWRSPTGADVELLRTTVEVRLAPDGSIVGAPRVIAQTGVNDSNRVQADLHKERALKAVQLAAPFQNLPPEYYDAWKVIKPVFDRRLGS